MGNWLYTTAITDKKDGKDMGKYTSEILSRKLCDDIVHDDEDFVIDIWVYTTTSPVDLRSVMEHLQKTHPMYSYTSNRYITLIYAPNKKTAVLRSNVSGEMISGITYEVTSYLIKNKICEPINVEVSISIEKSDTALKKLLNRIAEANYIGHMHGIDKLSKEVIEEQFL